MYVALNLLIVGRSRQGVAEVIATLEGRQGLELHPFVLNAGQMLLPEYLRPVPDGIVFVVDEEWRQEIWEIIDHIPAPRPPLFIISHVNDMEILRLAMRYGVRDVFPLPLQVEDCIDAISHVVHDERIRQGQAGSRLIAFMNVKGGSGASLIAANVALAIAQKDRSGRPILLLDFDFQFGGLPTYLNLVARDGLLKAMEFIDTLDAAALPAYVLRHQSGLHLLAAAMDEIIVPEDISAERTQKLLGALNGAYTDIIIDLPHRIDLAMATILGHADVIALVTQQTVAHLHDTKRLLFLLRDRLGIALDRIVLLLNRYDPKAEVRLEDFAEVFPQVHIQTLPSDYPRAIASINLGIPICESAANSHLGKTLLKLARDLAEGEGLPGVALRPQAGAAEPGHKGSGKKGMFGWLKR